MWRTKWDILTPVNYIKENYAMVDATDIDLWYWINDFLIPCHFYMETRVEAKGYLEAIVYAKPSSVFPAK